jgi:4-carboxymuconolactone decarboxylase
MPRWGGSFPPMARLPYVDPASAPPPVREALEVLPPLNIFRTLAHAETAFRPSLRLGAAILGDQKLDPVLRELAILRVAHLTPHAEYEWVQHVPIALAVGATQEQVDAIESDDLGADALDELQRATLRFTDEVIFDARASDEAYQAVAASLSDREIVELLLAIGYYMMLARVMATVEIDLDAPVGSELIDQLDQRG